MKKLIYLFISICLFLLVVVSTNVDASDDTYYCPTAISEFSFSSQEFIDSKASNLNVRILGDATITYNSLSYSDNKINFLFNSNGVGDNLIVIYDLSTNKTIEYRVAVFEANTLDIIKNSDNTYSLSANGHTNLLGDAVWHENNESLNLNASEKYNASTTVFNADYAGLNTVYLPTRFSFGAWTNIVLYVTAGIVLLVILIFFIKILFSNNVYKVLRKNLKKLENNLKPLDDKKYAIKSLSSINIKAHQLYNVSGLIKNNLPEISANLYSKTRHFLEISNMLLSAHDAMSLEEINSVYSHMESLRISIITEVDKVEQKFIEIKKVEPNKKIKLTKDDYKNQEKLEAIKYLKTLK